MQHGLSNGRFPGGHRSLMDDGTVDDVVAARARLATLRTEHRALDDWIAALAAAPFVDQLEIRRLKKRKLNLRDEISRLEDQLTPDIIA